MQHNLLIRTMEDTDYPFVLRLNKENVEVLSSMNEAQLDYFKENAELFRIVEVDGKPAAFIIVFREGADYQSENYRWFSGQYSQFLYVDRIVIDAPYRKIGLGKQMYRYVFEYARRTKIPIVTAEIDIAPVYNEPSLRFHSSMGFEEVGTQYVRNKTVKVSLQKAEVSKKRCD